MAPSRQEFLKNSVGLGLAATRFVVNEHWGSSGFANTNLDFLLKQKKITHVIVIGLLANTCIEMTSKFAVELGYHVTLVKERHGSVQPGPYTRRARTERLTYAHATLTTKEVTGAASMFPSGITSGKE